MPLPGRKEPGTVIITQPKRFFLDMSAYMMAVKGAENVDFTQRVKLYDMYADILSDGHLSSVIEKRKAALQCSQIEFRRNGKPDEKINTVLQSPWFFDFIGDVMDANFWGFSLFQFYLDDKGWMNYELIPRKNYDPVRRLLLHRESQITGTSIDEFRDTLLSESPVHWASSWTLHLMSYTRETTWRTGRNSVKCSECLSVNILMMRETTKHAT